MKHAGWCEIHLGKYCDCDGAKEDDFDDDEPEGWDGHKDSE